MSAKNRRHNNQRAQEVDNTISLVQCDGLVSNYAFGIAFNLLNFVKNCSSEIGVKIGK